MAEQTPDERDAKERADMREAWTKGRQLANETAERCQVVGDTLAGYLAEVWRMAPGVPKADPAEWYHTEWPLAGVERETIGRCLGRAMAGAYAFAGTYRRAATEFDAALQADDASLGHAQAAKRSKLDEMPF